MAHTDRQPSDLVFNDIKVAAERTWWNMYDSHRDNEDYIIEKINHRKDIVNFADNWCGFIQQFDSKNQMIFMELVEYQETIDFLRKMAVHYSYSMPRIKK